MLVVRLLRRRRATPSGNCSKWCLIRIRTNRGARAASARGTSEPFRAGSRCGGLVAAKRPRRDDSSARAVESVPKAPVEGPAASDSELFSAEMALTLITLSFLVSAVRVPDSKLAAGRSAKVQLVQLCQVAHEHFLGPEDATRLEDLLSDLKGAPRRQRPPLIVDSWDCSRVLQREKNAFSRPGVALAAQHGCWSRGLS